HLRLPDLLHRRASAGLSGRSRPAVRGGRLDARQHRPIQHRGRDRSRLARCVHAQALHPVAHLLWTRGGDPGLHPAAATIIFGAVMGLLWLSTVPPTSGLVAVMFGTRWLAMLFGFAFFSHQVGGFLGVWLGGVLFERTGSYDAVWWLSILLGL